MIKIALLGFGNVGKAFMRHLASTGANEEYAIYGIADVTGGVILREARDAAWVLKMKDQGRTVADCADRGTFSGTLAYINRLADEGISALVECLPTNHMDGQPALDLLFCAIDNGLAVVTVDKGPLVYGHAALAAQAQRKGTRFAYSGATGVRPPAEVTGCRVFEIRGILNGTTNFILTEMQERGLGFERALALAIDQGIAEPNPGLDIEGWDTACKILILANEHMRAGATLNDIARIGIGPETESLIADARAHGRCVRLIGRARFQGDRPRITVGPMSVGPKSVLHSIGGTSKGAVFATRERGELFAAGISGREAIAATILEDLRSVTSGSPRHAP